MASSWGKHLKIIIWGESHSESIGVVVDGLPAGEHIDWEQLLLFMGRRRSSGGATDTARVEADLPEIQSGVLHNATCGTPIYALIRNTNTRSKDYSLFEPAIMQTCRMCPVRVMPITAAISATTVTTTFAAAVIFPVV